MTSLTWDRSLLVGGYALLAVSWVVWWLAGVMVANAASLPSLLGVWLAAAVLVVATRWRAHERDVAPLPTAVGLAAATPLALVPVTAIGTDVATDIGMTAATVATIPLAWELSRHIPDRLARPIARVCVGACIGGAIVLVLFVASGMPASVARVVAPSELRWMLVATAVSVPAAAAALTTHRGATASGNSRMPAALGYLGIAFAVSVAGIALAVDWWPKLVIPALAVAATVAFLGRFAIRPLEAEAGEVRAQRDLVVSALEAERSRVAAAIHDGPLGDLALLVQRLDDAKDSENAGLARSIASDLRILGNELRVPILEDLGAGPAIEWLADRVSERSHMPIETELRSARERPPSRVELAVFRVAQEAMLNAVKHGRGPIRVRYEADSSTASLSVIDEGPGIGESARRQAVRDGHLGLILMSQRAEAIGARLELSSRTAGGTRVDLDWAAT